MVGIYEILKNLKTTEFQKVKLAKDLKNDREVVIKLMKKDSDEETLNQMTNEI
tara:strand:+ start:598 stop:756 length:159 start_codon:yes stop_codon:yes gene_type:complete